MRKTYLALAAAGLILASCQKDNEPSAQLPPTAPRSAMTLLGTIDASTPESRTHLDEEAGGGGNSSLVKWNLYDAVALYMTGAFDRRVQELADSVAQGLQPSVQFITPEFYVVKSAESIDNTTATFTGTSAVTPTMTPPKNAYWIFKITPPMVTKEPKIRHSVQEPPM